MELLRFATAGFNEVHVHQIGPDQDGFFRFYECEILPRFAAGGAARTDHVVLSHAQ